jgi:hypothetical protein
MIMGVVDELLAERARQISRDQQRFLFQFSISTLNIVLNLALAGRFGAFERAQ